MLSVHVLVLELYSIVNDRQASKNDQVTDDEHGQSSLTTMSSPILLVSTSC